VILVAEDNPVNAAVIVAKLKQRGYRTELVPDGREALAAFSRSRFDAVLMDCQMPELDVLPQHVPNTSHRWAITDS
jgi:two-component system sensor histidine kinase/response regulator